MDGAHRLGQSVTVRASSLLGQAAAFAVMVALLWIGGRHVVDRMEPAPSSGISAEDAGDMEALFDEDGEAVQPSADQPDAASGEEAGRDSAALERLPAREPLGDLGQALPPPPPDPVEDTSWDGTVLHRPIAVSAGRLDAMGYEVTIAGVESVPADAMCTYEGDEWACGVNARTAFRAFMRSRSPTCAIPADAAPGPLSVACRMGSQDIGAWLVENGWARAAADGPYADIGAKAERAGRGIFGPRPDTSIVILPPPPSPTEEPAPTVRYTPTPAGQPEPSQ